MFGCFLGLPVSGSCCKPQLPCCDACGLLSGLGCGRWQCMLCLASAGYSAQRPLHVQHVQLRPVAAATAVQHLTACTRRDSHQALSGLAAWAVAAAV